MISGIVDKISEVPDKRRLRYRPGQLIIKEGDFGIALYRIIRGTVSVLKELASGSIVLFELGPDDIFGEMVFIDGGHSPRTASVEAKDDVELEAWHYLSVWNEYQAVHPIIRLLAVDMVKKLQKISAIHDRLRIEKQPKEKAPGAAAGETTVQQIKVKEPAITLKLAGTETIGKDWEGQVEYRLLDDPSAHILKGTGIDVDMDGIRVDIAYLNMNQSSHEPGSKIELLLHLSDGMPVKVRGDLMSLSRGALMGHSAFRVKFSTLTPEAKKRIEALIKQ